MNADETLSLSTEPEEDPAPEAVFDIGERTIFQMRNQAWSLDEFGTVVLRPPQATPAAEGPAVAEPSVPEDDAPVTGEALTRIERKLDATLRALEALQRRVESIDAVMARIVSR